jgi:hypothetical protein
VLFCGYSLFLILCATLSLSAKAFDKTAQIGGMTLHYKIALPKDYDPSKTYPAVLAFPPGSQDMNMVLTTTCRTGFRNRTGAATSW